MKTPITRIIAITAAAGMLAGFNLSGAEADDAGNPKDPIVLCHPQTQVVKLKKEAKFEVRAKNPDPPFVHQTLTYQWQRRGPGLTNFDNIGGATNDVFTIARVSTNDVAYYRVTVTCSQGTKASSTTISEPAQLLVFTRNSPLTVFGSPVVSGGSSSGDCPGSYVGYVTYDKGVDWGWAGDHALLNKTHKAADKNGSTTKVEPYGYERALLCDSLEVRIPHGEGEDSKYQFTIYFSTSVPTAPYPITLTGFKP